MQLKASCLLALAAAQTGQALVVSRAGMATMNAAGEEAAKRAWLAKLGKPGWVPAVAPEEAKPAYLSRRDTQQVDQVGPLKKQLELDEALGEVKRQRDELSRSIAVEEAEKGNAYKRLTNAIIIIGVASVDPT